MTPTERITALAQSIHLAVFGRYNDVTGTALEDFLAKTIDWVNQFAAELELETDWNWLRTNDNNIGTVADGTRTYALPAGVRKGVISPYRDLVLKSDGSTISTFALVQPDHIADPSDPDYRDRATFVNGNLILSRDPKATEVGADIVCDTLANMPVLTTDDVTLLDTVKPLQLLVLGTAKNRALPDLVRGGISPSLAQTYKDLLDKCIADNLKTSDVMYAPREDFGFIRGVF